MSTGGFARDLLSSRSLSSRPKDLEAAMSAEFAEAKLALDGFGVFFTDDSGLSMRSLPEPRLCVMGSLF